MTKESRLILIGTVTGRTFGYLRELTIVYLFGISREADDVVFLLTSFDSLASVFAYGTITLISIRYVSGNIAYFLKLRTFFYFLGFLYAFLCSALIYFNASGFNWGMLVPFVALLNIDYSMSLAKQQVKSDFGWSAFTSVIINIILISAILVYPDVLSFLAIIGFGLVVRNFLISRYNKVKGSFSEQEKVLSTNEKRNIVFTVFGTGLFYLVPVVDRFLASSFGQIALFNYGDRILMFAVVLINGAFIYPSILSSENSGVGVTLKAVLHSRKLLFILCFVLAFFPFVISRFLGINNVEMESFLDFSGIHMFHFLPPPLIHG